MTTMMENERVSYQAWGLSVALHGLLIGSALLISTQVAPIIKEEVFRWDVALVQAAPKALQAETAQPMPAILPSKPVPVQIPNPLPSAEARSDMGMTRVATPPIPEIVQLPIAPPKPEPAKEMIEAKAKPVEPQEIRKEEIKREEVAPQEVVKPEPVRSIDQAVPAPATLQAQPEPGPHSVHHTPSAQAAPPVSVPESTHPSPVAQQMSHQPVIHHEEVSPEDLAPSWRALTPVGEPVSRGAEHAPASVAAEPPSQSAAAPVSSSGSPKVSPAPKADNTWLAESLGRRIRELTRYPSSARLNGWEGKVVLRVVIRSDGHLADVTVHRSSGHEVLDRAAMETIRLACPIHMKQTLSAAEVAVYVPIVYSLAG